MKGSKNFIEISAVAREIAKPTAIIVVWPSEKEEKFFIKSKPVAPAIVGMASKNENSTIVFLGIPSHKPPNMVAPARDTPGITEIAWKRRSEERRVGKEC